MRSSLRRVVPEHAEGLQRYRPEVVLDKRAPGGILNMAPGRRGGPTPTGQPRGRMAAPARPDGDGDPGEDVSRSRAPGNARDAKPGWWCGVVHRREFEVAPVSRHVILC